MEQTLVIHDAKLRNMQGLLSLIKQYSGFDVHSAQTYFTDTTKQPLLTELQKSQNHEPQFFTATARNEILAGDRKALLLLPEESSLQFLAAYQKRYSGEHIPQLNNWDAYLLQGSEQVRLFKQP